MVSSLKKLIRFPGRGAKARGDGELIEAIQGGDQEAWAAFLARYSDLLYGKARQYSRSSGAWMASDDREDEVAELYLFMAQRLQRSLNSFRGDCAPATWVHAVVGRRAAIINGFLRQKDSQRSDTRLPQAMQERPPEEQEIFRRLVWGLAPADIALELDLPEELCAEVEALLARRSPQVYQRVLENRCKRQPELHLDGGGEAPDTDQVAAADPAPDQLYERSVLIKAVRAGLAAAWERLAAAERRVLLLLYNHGARAEEVVELAADGSLGKKKINLNRIYYLKDKGLAAVLDEVVKALAKEGVKAAKKPEEKRFLLGEVEVLLGQVGLPEERAGLENSKKGDIASLRE